jgi:acetyltransferase-like isoleucine patch superfamily enzyme
VNDPLLTGTLCSLATCHLVQPLLIGVQLALRDLLSEERNGYAAWVIARRVIDRITGRVHGLALNWPEARVPLTSVIIGSKKIQVKAGFSAHGPVWIEAISRYDGHRYEAEIKIGQRFRASDGIHITAIDSITIGDDCLFGSNVYVADHAHGDYRSSLQSTPDSIPAARRLTKTGAVVIGSNCWIGDNCVVLGGVTIGAGSIVAANSVVLSDVPPMAVVAGAPARVVKIYQPEFQKWESVSRQGSKADL